MGTAASPYRLMINVESSSVVFSPNCIVLLAIIKHVTSAYHPEANGLAERQNRTIKNSLIKALGSNLTDWPNVIEGVLFAHRFIKEPKRQCFFKKSLTSFF